MPSAPICILNDLTLPLPLYSPHNFSPLPPVPPVPPTTPAVPMAPAPASAIELPMNMLWPPGNMVFKHKYAFTVVHKFLGIILAGHDIGIMIPHVQAAPAPNNFFTPLQILFSSRKVNFSSSTVKAEGTNIGLAGMIGLPPTPMMICADPMSFPLGEVPTRWLNTVHVGLTWGDTFWGMYAIATSLLLEKLIGKLFPAKDAPKTAFGQLKKQVKDLKDAAKDGIGAAVYKKMFPVQSAAEAWKTAKKQLSGMLAGVVSSFGQGQGGALSVSLGSSFAQVSVTVGRDAAGNTTASAKVQVVGLSESVSGNSSTGTTAQADANWGSGGGTAKQGATNQVSTHNTVHGETTSEKQ